MVDVVDRLLDLKGSTASIGFQADAIGWATGHLVVERIAADEGCRSVQHMQVKLCMNSVKVKQWTR